MGARRIDLPLPRGIHDAESYVMKVLERPGLSGHYFSLTNGVGERGKAQLIMKMRVWVD